MTVFTKTAVDVFAAQDASGAARKVSNHDAQVWGTEVERALAAFQAGGGVIFQSKDQADANLGYDANTMAWVFDDDPSLAGIYQKQGASGSGSWQRVGDLPYSFILATNTNSGDPNAIEATTATPIPAADGGALIALPIVADNTASPVTVSFNGGSALTVKTIAGNDAPASALANGMIIWGFKQGDEFRLVTDLSSAGILAGAEAAAEAAEDAADRAQSYSAMLSADKVKFKTVAELLADETMSYTPGSGLIEVGPGDIIEAQGFRYEVAASGATDEHVETAGGVKLYVRDDNGCCNLAAFGPVSDLKTDIGPAFNAALSAGFARIVLPKKDVYASAEDIHIDYDVEVEGWGSRVLFAPGKRLTIEGVIESKGAVFAAAADAGDQEIELSDISGIEEGDVLILLNTEDYSYSDYREYYHDGEAVEVAEVEENTEDDGGTVHLRASLETSYGTGSNFVVSVLKGISPNLSGITFRSDTSANFKYTKDARFTRFGYRVTGANANYGVISQFSFRDRYEQCRFYNKDTDANGYALCFAGAWYTKGDQVHCYSRRHAISIGGTADNPPNRHLRFRDSLFKSYAHTVNNTNAADVHGLADDVVFDNCVAFGGVVLGGSNSVWNGGKIHGNLAQSPMQSREIPKGTCTYSNVEVWNHSANQADYGAHASSEHDRPKGDITHILHNIHLHRSNPSNTREIIVVPSGENADTTISLDADGISYDFEPATYLTVFSREDGLTKIRMLSLKNVNGPSPQLMWGSGVFPRLEAGVSRITMPSQSALATANIAAGGSGNFGVVFPTRYPDWPYVQLDASPIGDTGGRLSILKNGLLADVSGRYYYTEFLVTDPETTLSGTTSVTLMVTATVDNVLYQ